MTFVNTNKAVMEHIRLKLETICGVGDKNNTRTSRLRYIKKGEGSVSEPLEVCSVNSVNVNAVVSTWSHYNICV
jgi:hypothetical protein